tara:strand:+ start:2719 stop:3606 length:888 start_codon:yes stop_codon:yes gene_type:complete
MKEKKKKRYENASIDLLDIIRGFSVLEYSGQQYYFKHLKLMDAIEVDNEQIEDIKKSIKSGISTSDELIEQAIQSGAWSKEKEESIKSQKWMIKKSTAALAKITDPTQRKIFNNSLLSQEKDLKEIEAERGKLIAYSAEHLAELKKVKRTYDRCVFSSKDFDSAPDPKNRDALTVMLFSRYNDLMSHERVLEASYKGGFFDLYVTQRNNPIGLIDTTFQEITVFQKTLLVLSSSLLNKIRNTSIPDEIYGDPVKMFNYEEKSDEADRKVSHGTEDLKAKIKARGGELKAEDFLSG